LLPAIETIFTHAKGRSPHLQKWTVDLVAIMIQKSLSHSQDVLGEPADEALDVMKK
jgi:hypothetical protein